MAIRHGLAGKYGKAEALKITQRVMLSLLTLSLLDGIVMGALIARGFNSWGILALLVAGIVFVPAIRRVDRLMAESARDRIKYMRGGQAEGLIAWILEDLDDGWHIFNGVKLEENSDIDHIVVGPGGLYCISTKSTRGHFSVVDGRTLLHNGRKTDLLENTLAQAMRLRDRLAALLGDQVPYVNAVLAVPLGYVEVNGPRRNVLIFHQDDIVEGLERGGKRLSATEVTRTAGSLEMLERSAAKVYRRPDNK
jgi:hypothetical protein